MIRHEEYKEGLAAHALGALDQTEARDLEVHLTTCDECRAELEAWQETAAEMAYAAPMVPPPASLRSRLLESVRAEGAPQEARAHAKGGIQREARAPVEPVQAAPPVLPFEKRARRLTGAASKLFALAASVAFVALIVSLILLWNRYNAMKHEVARLADRFEQAQAELGRERELVARERESKELVYAPNASMASLAGTEMAEKARAKLVFDRKTGHAMLMADDLPPAPAGKAYQLWFIAEGKPPMPGRVFTPDAAGHAEMRAELPFEARNATIFAVTLEPSGGVAAPTGPKYLLSAS